MLKIFQENVRLSKAEQSVELRKTESRVATIRRLKVKMAPGGSIHALKVGQFAVA